MGEWWTYRPSDFLMFSAASHARLLESYNRDHWPLHLLMVAVAAVLAWSMARPSRQGTRAAAASLALTWAWVSGSFHWNRFSEINTAALYFAAAWALQAIALLACAALPVRHFLQRSWPGAGAALLGTAVLLWPLLALVTGRGWRQAEYFGMAPEPTALATLGWLLAVAPRLQRLLVVIPALSLLVGAGTLWLLVGPR
jgi:hypothetical protein